MDSFSGNTPRPGDPAPARHRLLLWANSLIRVPKVVATQNGKFIGRKTLPWPPSPGRVFRVPSSILSNVDARGGPVTLSLDPHCPRAHAPCLAADARTPAAEPPYRMRGHRCLENQAWAGGRCGGLIVTTATSTVNTPPHASRHQG